MSPVMRLPHAYAWLHFAAAVSVAACGGCLSSTRDFTLALSVNRGDLDTVIGIHADTTDLDVAGLVTGTGTIDASGPSVFDADGTADLGSATYTAEVRAVRIAVVGLDAAGVPRGRGEITVLRSSGTTEVIIYLSAWELPDGGGGGSDAGTDAASDAGTVGGDI